MNAEEKLDDIRVGLNRNTELCAGMSKDIDWIKQSLPPLQTKVEKLTDYHAKTKGWIGAMTLIGTIIGGLIASLIAWFRR